MYKKLLCNLFHRKNWMSFDNRAWLMKYKKSYIVICLKCGRYFKRNRRLTHDELVTSLALNDIIKDCNNTFNNETVIEDGLIDTNLNEKRRYKDV